ncbi:MAG: complex I NDUFA9 subunit family protein [Rhodobacteraceae bacterium]|nr:complex I NDUFA9 subunit family protein [Paracoccaceae bacterium]
MGKLVTIYGGSGFLGRYVARRMAQQGWRVRVASRRPNEALFVKTYGAVGQVEPVFCNVRDDASVALAMKGADAVVNCVGTFDKGGKNNFQAVHVEASGRIARAAAAAGVGALVHVSALGADSESDSGYYKSKAEGEKAVSAAFPGAAILRPSVMFGAEDGLFNRFASLSRFGPILPLVGKGTRFQPVFVDDVASAAVTAIEGGKKGVFELGGPEVATLGDLVKDMLTVIDRRRLVVAMPFWKARMIGGVFDFVSFVTGGLITNAVLTRDQVKMLRHDNVAKSDGLGALGVTPTPMHVVLPEYLWRYRPSGQYQAIKDSARNLRTDG